MLEWSCEFSLKLTDGTDDTETGLEGDIMEEDGAVVVVLLWYEEKVL